MEANVISKLEKRKRGRKEEPASHNVEPITGAKKQQQREKNQSTRDRPAIRDGAIWPEEDGTPIDD
jgi:hypothetical protein